MPRNTAVKKQKAQPEEELKLVKRGNSFWDYFRFGESYTSLILGIIVVIIATAMLLSFVHNKNAGNTNTPINQQTQNTVQLSQKVQSLAQQAPITPNDSSTTTSPTDTVAPTAIPTPTTQPKPTAKPTAKPQSKVTPKPVAKHVEVSKAKPTPTKQPEKKVVAAKHEMSKKVAQNNQAKKTIWVVQKGESLWSIAEKKYTSGYNWVDIARVNNLSNPSDIHAGDRLVLPNVPTKTPTLLANNTGSIKATKQVKANKSIVQQNYTSIGSAITGNSYTVAHGDNLWNIAVRAYGDGFRWVDIARANNLSNPRMIFSGNVLIIPRN